MLLSIAIICLGGFICGRMAEMLKIPRLVGMLLFGILIGPHAFNLLDPLFLTIAPDLKEIALIIILTRAGLSLDIEDLKKIGLPAVLMSFVPACFEIGATTLLAPYFLGLSTIDSLLLGTVIASSSPAVIVPRMLHLIDTGYGTNKQIPQLILTGDSVDDVFNIVLFSAVLSMQTSQEIQAASLLLVPVNILLGIVVGMLASVLIYYLFKNFHMRGIVQVMTLLSVSFLLVTLENYFEYSALLAVMVIGLVLYKKLPKVAEGLSRNLATLWIVAEIFLFAILGTSVNIQYASNSLLPTIILLCIVLVIRGIGIYLCLHPTNYNWKEKLYCMLTGIPKATVQAAIGGLPLAAGVASGPIILSVAVISILFAAPVGAFILDKSYPYLLTKSK